MIPTGLGSTLFVCRADDLKKNPDTPMELLGEPISIGPGLLTSEGYDTYKKPRGFHSTFTADKEEEDTIASVARQLNNSKLMMEVTPNIRNLPRKMKKAILTGQRYRRDTRWKRKAAQWKKRNKLTLLGNITSDGNGDYTFTGCKVE